MVTQVSEASETLDKSNSESSPLTEVRRQLADLREKLKTAPDEEYEKQFNRWEEAVGRLAEVMPIDRERGGIFDIELPGDYRAIRTVFSGAENWLRRGLSEETADDQIFDFLTALRELTNNEFEHSLALGEPVADSGQSIRRKPERSVWFGLILFWRDDQPVVEALLETSGRVPSREVLNQYFDINEEKIGNQVRLKLEPKPELGPAREDFCPDLGNLLVEGGRGLSLVASLMGKEDKLEITWLNQSNQSESDGHHSVRLVENLAA